MSLDPTLQQILDSNAVTMKLLPPTTLLVDGESVSEILLTAAMVKDVVEWRNWRTSDTKVPATAFVLDLGGLYAGVVVWWHAAENGTNATVEAAGTTTLDALRPWFDEWMNPERRAIDSIL